MKWALPLLFIGVLISCSEDNMPLRTVFSLTVDKSYKLYDPSPDSTYIIIHNTDGDLLEYKLVQSGDEIRFDERLVGDRIDVTIARVYPDGSGGGLANVWTYLDVSGGQWWTLRHDQVEYGPARQASEVGAYTMILNNITPLYAMSISDHYYSVTSRRSNSPLSLKAGIRKDIPKQLLSLHNGEGSPRYQFIEPKVDETYTIDYNTMAKFDTVVSVGLTEPSFIYAHVMGYETMEDFRYLTGYVLYDNSNSSGVKRSLVNLGYLKSMKKFSTELTVSNGRANVTYASRGVMNGGIFLPKFDDIVLLERSAGNLTYTSKVDVAYRVSWFVSTNLSAGTNGTNWYIHAPGKRSVQPSVPEALVKKFPKIGANSMRHATTTFYTQSWTYEKFLEREFGNVRKAEEDQYEDVAVILN